MRIGLALEEMGLALREWSRKVDADLEDDVEGVVVYVVEEGSVVVVEVKVLMRAAQGTEILSEVMEAGFSDWIQFHAP